MARDTPSPTSVARAHSTLLRLALPSYTIHFKSPSYFQPATLDLLDKKVLKATLKATSLEKSIRETIGHDSHFWQEMRDCLRAGVRGCEARSFRITNLPLPVEEGGGGGVGGDDAVAAAAAGEGYGGAGGVDYESTSGALIAGNYPGLWRDLERLNEIVAIGRNVLTTGLAAQDLAAEWGMENEVFRLVNCCVRVTARGYDGDAGTGEEEKWQWIVNAYKKLLITSLQWVNNFSARNEKRKLALWVALFDSSNETPAAEEDDDAEADEDEKEKDETTLEEAQQSQQPPEPQQPPQQRIVEISKSGATLSTSNTTTAPTKPTPPINGHDILLAYGTNGTSRISPIEMEGAIPLYRENNTPHVPANLHGFKPPPTQITTLIKKSHFDPNGYVFFTHQHRERAVEIYQRDHRRSPSLAEIHRAIPVLWEEERAKAGKSEKRMWELWRGLYDRALGEYQRGLEEETRVLREERRALQAAPAPPPAASPSAAAVAAEEEKKRKVEEARKAEEKRVEVARKPVLESAAPKPIERWKVDEKVRALEEQLRERQRVVQVLEEQLKERQRMGLEDKDEDAAATTDAPTAAGGFVEREGASAVRGVTPPASLDVRTTPSPVVASSAPKDRDDAKMPFTAEAGSKILESGKAELMKRLEGYPEEDELAAAAAAGGEADGDTVAVSGRSRMRNARRNRRRQSLSSAFAAVDSIASDEGEADDQGDRDFDDSEEDDDDDEEEEDYSGSSEDGRGLLTDVPLILGPSEIEVLPMLVMSGIVAPTPSSSDDPSQPRPSPPPPPEQPQESDTATHNTTTILTHLLLSQTAGRNLLRELLIFVAAWDLREEELYFKFMVKICEAILACGLMPYAYHSFRDRSRSKDIISPAQAVIMKLLTSIFRHRNEAALSPDHQQSAADHREGGGVQSKRPPVVARNEVKPIAKVELGILNFIFTEFRQHIIPQTCALIFLQGQIHAGRASPEDFPLNLWDMERMYEGVYQFLEFFAVLAEERNESEAVVAVGEKRAASAFAAGGKGQFKRILGEWEMCWELVTLLRELEGGIPKGMGGAGVAALPRSPSPLPAPQLQAQPNAEDKRGMPTAPLMTQRSLSADAAMMPSAVSVERPFELDDSTLASSTQNPNRIFEPETPLAYPEEQSTPAPAAAAAPAPPPSTSPPSMHDQDEPSDFEWRNLKKLTVLVLSSLIWKNARVQEQLRVCGGLEALVACCRPDEHNPYIREHAIMCLRFAVEGCEANRVIIEKMAETGGGGGGGGVAGVPREVLDTGSYETFMDSKGQVGLRRKDRLVPQPQQGQYAAPNTAATLISGGAGDRSGTASAPPPASATTQQAPSVQAKLSAAMATKMTAEKAAELMQNALRDLPLGEKLVTDRQKAEALARLDRAFERTEVALSSGEASASASASGAGTNE